MGFSLLHDYSGARLSRSAFPITETELNVMAALASIGLTVPAVVLVAALFDLPLVLGLAAKDMVLMTLSFVVGSIALGSGRTNMMQGAVQLVIFAAFLFLSLVP